MEQRRQFIKKMVAGSVAASALPHLLSGKGTVKGYQGVSTPLQDDAPVRIALIGKGGMGTGDTRTALQVPGVKLVAVCDLYDERLQSAKKEWGDDIFVTRDYKEILSRNDVDAVIVGTSDHWHQKISIDAMKAGKHVYCEKPVIHKISEAKDLIKAQKLSGCVFQSGSQGIASIGNRKAKQLVQSGAIGQVNLIEAAFTSGPRQACRVPDGISPEDIWWDRYIMNAPKVAFAPDRFFCWRNWKDYGTGIAGDLFVHVLSSLQYIMDSSGPGKVYTTGDVDGIGDTPYIMLGYFDYPAKNGKNAFKAALTANYADGVSGKWGSLDFTIIGSEGTLRVQWDKVTLKKPRKVSVSDFNGLASLGNTIDKPEQISDNELLFVEKGYNRCHLDHFTRFFDGIRKRTKVDADVMFAVQTAVPAVMCFESYLSGKPVYWDPEKLKIKKS
ncbi:MAG: Gfo/Idh/MocA family oxidoreductase [Bacteroidales bacterium]|jgi:predicted dehydrogenase|nr:Gfo/Idh/MocA family oxidoreductase [Bacteroidales bacterium]